MTETDREVDIRFAVPLFDDEEGLVLNGDLFFILHLVVLDHVHSLTLPFEFVILGGLIIGQVINLVLLAVELGDHHKSLRILIRWLVPSSDLSFGVTILGELLNVVIDCATVNELSCSVDIEVESIIAPDHLRLVARPHFQVLLSSDSLRLFW
jgi:hypothetical protein